MCVVVFVRLLHGRKRPGGWVGGWVGVYFFVGRSPLPTEKMAVLSLGNQAGHKPNPCCNAKFPG